VEKSIVQRRIDMLKKCGVQFRLPVRLWEDPTLARLRTEFDAVFLGFDARQARTLNVPGANLKNVLQGLPFLLQKTTPLALDMAPVDVTGKRVVVVGGGDTAMDCLRAAIRYGAREALCVYRRDEADLPCGRKEYRDTIEEGAHCLFRATPVELIGDNTGYVKRLRLAKTEPDAACSETPRPFLVRKGETMEVEADLVILALGFDPLPCPAAGDFQELEINPQGGLKVDDNQMTSLPGVFAGGDIVRGPTTLLYSVRDARRAAERMHLFLAARQGSGAQSG
jgi:glutamate synthase (NADPH/NADH) small chain